MCYTIFKYKIRNLISENKFKLNFENLTRNWKKKKLWFGSCSWRYRITNIKFVVFAQLSTARTRPRKAQTARKHSPHIYDYHHHYRYRYMIIMNNCVCDIMMCEPTHWHTHWWGARGPRGAILLNVIAPPYRVLFFRHSRPPPHD